MFRRTHTDSTGSLVTIPKDLCQIGCTNEGAGTWLNDALFHPERRPTTQLSPRETLGNSYDI